MSCQWRTVVGSCIRRVREGERCGVSGGRWSGVASEEYGKENDVSVEDDGLEAKDVFLGASVLVLTI